MEVEIKKSIKLQNAPELLAPAGNMECLAAAIEYGADAVYIGAKRFSLRAFADNFEDDEIFKSVDFAHKKNVKVYVAMNIFARNYDFNDIESYIKLCSDAKVDAIILSDPGILSHVMKAKPNFDIHLSTQANTTNWRSAIFWHSLGIKRIILSRELSLDEIIQIRLNTPKTLEIESFIHGSMCVAISGRCALSNYMTGRDANKGECSQPCRWKYFLTEETRPGQYMPVFEDDRGSYILNSKDLCMIEHIDLLIKSGINSFKIEGRMKGMYYVSTVVRVYRNEIDSFLSKSENYLFNKDSLIELKKVSHRGFTTGFYFGHPTNDDHSYDSSKYTQNCDFVGLVTNYCNKEKMMQVEQRNNFAVGDELEIVTPRSNSHTIYKVTEIYDEFKSAIRIAPHAQQKLYLPLHFEVAPYSILRRVK